MQNDEAYTSPNRSITFLKRVLLSKMWVLYELANHYGTPQSRLKIPFLQVKLI